MAQNAWPDGRLHTGHWLIDVETGQATGLAVSTVVKFSDVADDEIRDYVVTGEPLQVAGAFTLEDGPGCSSTASMAIPAT